MGIIEKLKSIPSEYWKKWGKNLLKHTLPILVIFFTQLSNGVSFKLAGMVALYAAAAAIADFFKKMDKFL